MAVRGESSRDASADEDLFVVPVVHTASGLRMAADLVAAVTEVREYSLTTCRYSDDAIFFRDAPWIVAEQAAGETPSASRDPHRATNGRREAAFAWVRKHPIIVFVAPARGIPPHEMRALFEYLLISTESDAKSRVSLTSGSDAGQVARRTQAGRPLVGLSFTVVSSTEGSVSSVVVGENGLRGPSEENDARTTERGSPAGTGTTSRRHRSRSSADDLCPALVLERLLLLAGARCFCPGTEVFRELESVPGGRERLSAFDSFVAKRAPATKDFLVSAPTLLHFPRVQRWNPELVPMDRWLEGGFEYKTTDPRAPSKGFLELLENAVFACRNDALLAEVQVPNKPFDGPRNSSDVSDVNVSLSLAAQPSRQLPEGSTRVVERSKKFFERFSLAQTRLLVCRVTNKRFAQMRVDGGVPMRGLSARDAYYSFESAARMRSLKLVWASRLALVKAERKEERRRSRAEERNEKRSEELSARGEAPDAGEVANTPRPRGDIEGAGPEDIESGAPVYGASGADGGSESSWESEDSWSSEGVPSPVAKEVIHGNRRPVGVHYQGARAGTATKSGTATAATVHAVQYRAAEAPRVVEAAEMVEAAELIEAESQRVMFWRKILIVPRIYLSLAIVVLLIVVLTEFAVLPSSTSVWTAEATFWQHCINPLLILVCMYPLFAEVAIYDFDLVRQHWWYLHARLIVILPAAVFVPWYAFAAAGFVDSPAWILITLFIAEMFYPYVERARIYLGHSKWHSWGDLCEQVREFRVARRRNTLVNKRNTLPHSVSAALGISDIDRPSAVSAEEDMRKIAAMRDFGWAVFGGILTSSSGFISVVFSTADAIYLASASDGHLGWEVARVVGALVTRKLCCVGVHVAHSRCMGSVPARVLHYLPAMAAFLSSLVTGVFLFCTRGERALFIFLVCDQMTFVLRLWTVAEWGCRPCQSCGPRPVSGRGSDAHKKLGSGSATASTGPVFGAKNDLTGAQASAAPPNRIGKSRSDSWVFPAPAHTLMVGSEDATWARRCIDWITWGRVCPPAGGMVTRREINGWILVIESIVQTGTYIGFLLVYPFAFMVCDETSLARKVFFPTDNSMFFLCVALALDVVQDIFAHWYVTRRLTGCDYSRHLAGEWGDAVKLIAATCIPAYIFVLFNWLMILQHRG